MVDKIIIIGDSHTFYMSGDHRRKYYLQALKEDDVELYPLYWTSFFNDPDKKTTYCWKLGAAARKLTPEIIDEMLYQDSNILNSEKSTIHLVFALGVVDFFAKILHTKNPAEVAEQYFNSVYEYCKTNSFSFSFASPVYSNPVSYLIDEFNNTLIQMCKSHNAGDVITYPPSISYKKYEPVDRFNHPSFEILDSVADHIKKSF